MKEFRNIQCEFIDFFVNNKKQDLNSNFSYDILSSNVPNYKFDVASILLKNPYDYKCDFIFRVNGCFVCIFQLQGLEEVYFNLSKVSKLQKQWFSYHENNKIDLNPALEDQVKDITRSLEKDDTLIRSIRFTIIPEYILATTSQLYSISDGIEKKYNISKNLSRKDLLDLSRKIIENKEFTYCLKKVQKIKFIKNKCKAISSCQESYFEFSERISAYREVDLITCSYNFFESFRKKGLLIYKNNFKINKKNNIIIF